MVWKIILYLLCYFFLGKKCEQLLEALELAIKKVELKHKKHLQEKLKKEHYENDEHLNSHIDYIEVGSIFDKRFGEIICLVCMKGYKEWLHQVEQNRIESDK